MAFLSEGRVLGFAPQALGELVPAIANGYYYSTQSLLLGENQSAAYSALYTGQPAVAAVVDKIATAAARITVRVWDVTDPKGRKLDTTSPLAVLMANPCPEMPTFAFWRWTVSTYEIYGEAFWWKMRLPNDQVIGYLPMHPARTAIARNEQGEVEYIFTLGVASGGILKAPERDVVAFRRYNPRNLMRGTSRLEPLRTTLLNEDAARRASQSWWNKGARPSVVITHPGELSQGAKDRIAASFSARHAGADNMGGVSVLEEGMTTQVVQLSAEEMQYIESRKLNREEVCMVYDVPPPSIHVLDHATFSNITEQMRMVYRDTMAPRFEDYESVMDFSIVPDFAPSGKKVVEFDMSDVLRGDFETRADKAMVLRNSGIYTGNQALELVGAPRSDDPEMDRIYVNAAFVPLGTMPVKPPPAANPALAAPAHPALPPGPPLKSITSSRSFRSMIGKLATGVKTLKDAKTTLADEHATQLKEYFKKQKAALHRKDLSKLDSDEWNIELEQILSPLSSVTASTVGDMVSKTLNGEYYPDRLDQWLKDNSAASALNINKETARQLQEWTASKLEQGDTEPDTDEFFDDNQSDRADGLGASRVAMLAGLVSLVAAEQNHASTKTWSVTSPNPRPEHQAMDGETVPLGETFSNGMNGPGDMSGGADEVAGCTCELTFSREQEES